MLRKYNITAEGLLIILIVILAAFLRFWNFGALPFMHDEFSAIFRTWYDSVWKVIEIGVKQNDSHPAGVEVFIYFWIKLFGLSEPVLKLPFALMGVGSVLMTWFIGKRWFTSTTGFFSATLMSVTQYNIFYSQLARPYAAGLFFTLMAVWLWTKVVFDDKPGKSAWVWFVIFMAANSYIHAFTLFFNLMLGATGLFFTRGRRLKNYLWSGLAILLLFLPGISVFLAQLGRGDIGGWLAAPKAGFLLDYFFYLFHFSRWFLTLTIAILLFLSVKYYNRDKAVVKFRIIGASWFVITFLVAFIYSVYRSPIIQYSTLLFVFPFFVMVVFSFIGRLPKSTLLIALLIITSAGVFTLIFERLHYAEMYQQGFDQIPAHVIQDLNKYHDQKVAVVLQSPDTRMFDYYFDKDGKKPEYFRLEKSSTMADVNRYLEKNSADVILYGWADYAPLSYLESLKAAYPFVSEKNSWFNSEYYVLSKTPLPGGYAKSGNRQLMAVESNYKIYSKNRYGKAIKLGVDTLELDKYDVINVRVSVERDSLVPDDLLVFDWRDKEDKSVFWSGAQFKKFISSDSVFHLSISLRLMDLPELPKGGEIKFYIWKKDDITIRVRRMEVYLTHVSPVELGLYDKMR